MGFRVAEPRPVSQRVEPISPMKRMQRTQSIGSWSAAKAGTSGPAVFGPETVSLGRPKHVWSHFDAEGNKSGFGALKAVTPAHPHGIGAVSFRTSVDMRD